METSSPKKPYFEYLDALRCVAFLAVFYAHSGTIFIGTVLSDRFPLGFLKKFTVYGVYGVNFFFVLSGFLITYLLLREKHARGKISIKNFYLKRVLRIWPVYFITLLFGTFILPLMIPSGTYSALVMTNSIISTKTFLYFFFFLGDFYQGLGVGAAPLAIGILWSVCVEEQFYLIWPWVVRWLNLRTLKLVTIFLISLSLLYKFIWANDRVGNYYLPWSVGMDLAFGALLGMFYFENKQRQVIIGAAITFCASLVVIACVLGLAYANVLHLGRAVQLSVIKSTLVEILRLLKTPIVDCLFMFLLLFYIQKTATLQTEKRHPIIKFFHSTTQKISRTLIYLGKISYGLYAYHATCLILTVTFLYSIGFIKPRTDNTEYFVVVIITLALSITVAHLSSVFIERRFAKLKEKLDS